MTAAELKNQVDDYFLVHLDSAYWKQQSDDTRMAACKMAASDVFNLLPGENMASVISSGSALLAAIAEQSVYLVRNYESQTEGKIATSEGMEGISTSYTLIGNNPGLSPRAQPYIVRAKRERLNSFRLSRG